MTLELRALTLTPHGGAPLFPALNLSVPPGMIYTVMGPSGVGKSTLLDAIGGHLAPQFRLQGEIFLDGLNVGNLPAEARRIGLMFQEALLFPHLSVGENLAFGLTPALRGRSARRQAIEAALDRAGLSGFFDRDPATLSGGQRARAALMRTRAPCCWTSRFRGWMQASDLKSAILPLNMRAPKACPRCW